MVAAQIIALLRAADKGQRNAGYDQLAALAEEGRDDASVIAQMCVAPLVDGVLCADASSVDAAEARQAGLLLGELMMLGGLPVTAAWVPKWSNDGRAKHRHGCDDGQRAAGAHSRRHDARGM